MTASVSDSLPLEHENNIVLDAIAVRRSCETPPYRQSEQSVANEYSINTRVIHINRHAITCPPLIKKPKSTNIKTDSWVYQSRGAAPSSDHLYVVPMCSIRTSLTNSVAIST